MIWGKILLPEVDHDFATRIRLYKSNLSKAEPKTERFSPFSEARRISRRLGGGEKKVFYRKTIKLCLIRYGAISKSTLRRTVCLEVERSQIHTAGYTAPDLRERTKPSKPKPNKNIA